MATRVRAAAVLAAFLLSSAFASAEEPLKGIELSDMDRSADACTDFFEFSNGAWRAANPIPPSMSRWSRRWQAGEESKERLKGILEETATKTGSAEGERGPARRRLLRGLHGHERPQRRRSRAGAALPRRDRARSRRPPTSDRRSAGSMRWASRRPSASRRAPTTTTRTTSLPRSTPAASGCRTATTTSRPSPASSRRARSTSPTSRSSSSSPAGVPAKAKAGAATVFAIEKKLAEASLDSVALPRSEGHRPQDHLGRPPENDSGFRLDGVREVGRIPAGATSTSTSRSSWPRSRSSSSRRLSPTGRRT